MLAGTLPAVLLCPAFARASTGTTADEKLVHAAANRFLKIVRSGGNRQDFSSLLESFVSVPDIALFALGKHRRKLEGERKGEYVALVNTMLLDTLVKHARHLRGREFIITGSRGDIVTGYVSHGNGRKTLIECRMRNGRIADVRVQGIWLALALREQFNRIIDGAGGKLVAIFAHLEP